MTDVSVQQTTTVDLSRFERLREAVRGALADLAEAATELSAPQMRARLEDASRKLAEEKFRLVVVGEFSHGKSTFINALLGSKVLPASNSPTTAVLTIIQEGSEPKYRIEYRDGSQIELTRERFLEIVAPVEPDTSDPEDVARFNAEVGNLAKVDVVRIEYPTALCAQGVEIVDTPGTNDLDVARERITYEFVPRADAVVFVLSARQILSEKELTFLTGRILKSDIGRLFFVINFKDFLDTPEKQRKIIAYAKDHLGPVVDEPRIYLICARDALVQRSRSQSRVPPMPLEETGVPEFEQALVQFLETSRFAAKLAGPIHAGVTVAADLLAGPLNMRRSTIGLRVQDVEQKIAELRPALAHARAEHRQILEGLRAHLAEEGEHIRADLKRGLEGIVSIGTSAVRQYEGELSKEKIAEAVERAVGRKHTEQIERARDRLQAALQKHCQRAEQRMEAVWANVIVKINTGAEHVNASRPIDIPIELPRVESDDEIRDMSVGAALGAVGLVALAHIFFPVAIVAGILTFFGLGSFLEAQRRKKLLDEVEVQVRQRLSDAIPPMLDACDAAWQRSSSEACAAFDTAYTARIEALEKEMRSLSRRCAVERRTAAEQYAECDRIQKNIERAVTVLRECRWAE